MREVRRLRQARGWNQTELAFHAGLAPSVISQIENGKRDPSAGTLRKLATALEVNVGDLFPKAQAPLPFEEEAEQWRRPFLEAWSSYLLRRAEEWEETLRERVLETEETAGELKELFSAAPGLAFEVLHGNERVQAEGFALLEIVGKAISDARQYVNPPEPTAKETARWFREERVSPREAALRRESWNQDVKELAKAAYRVEDAAEHWFLVAIRASDAARENERRAEAERSLQRANSVVEKRQKVVALFEERRPA